MKKWLLMLTLVLVVFGTVIGFNLFKSHKIKEYLANMPEAESPVTVMEVQTEDWVPVIEAIGFVEPNQGVNVSSEVAGKVATIGFENGATVKEGQLLVELDTEVEMANLKAQQARLPSVQARYSRYQNLFSKGSISKDQLDEAQADYLSLAAEIESLKATIERKNIKAPFSGIIGIRNINLGQYLQAGHDIVRLEDTSIMKLRFTVPQTRLAQIHTGQELHIKVDAFPDDVFTGRIAAIEPAVNYQSGVIQVQASIPNSEGRLRSGMFARAEIVLPTQTAQVVLPQTTVNFTLYGETVYVVKEDEDGVLRAMQTTVGVGERRGSQVHILSGLNTGDKVVTSGQVRLSHEAKVKIVEGNPLQAAEVPPQL